MQNTDAEPFGQDSGESTRLEGGGESLFELCHGLGDVGICGMKRLRIGLGIQVFVVEHLGAFNAVVLGQRAQIHVILGEKCGVVAIGVKDTDQTKSDEVEQVPAEERAVRHEAFPFMPFHHASGQANGVQSLDIRILRNDVRHHTVGILLDEEADDGETPKEQEHVFHKHGPCHARPFARVNGVEEATCRKLVIGTSFQQHTCHDDAVCFLNEQPDENVDGQREYYRHGDGDAAVMGDGINGVGHGDHHRAGCKRVEQGRDYSAATAERGIGIVVDDLLLVLLDLFTGIVFIAYGKILQYVIHVVGLRGILRLRGADRNVGADRERR